MAYDSAIAANRRSVMATSAAIGALFSLVLSLSLGRAGAAGVAVSLLTGLAEGAIIGGCGIALRALVPLGGRAFRVSLEFVLGSAVHAALAFGLAAVAGADTLALTPLVGFLAALVGELVCARESVILAREDAALAREGLARLPPGAARRFGLSDREAEVAELLVARASYKDIGERLYISLPTVKSHASAIYRKSGAASRGEFIAAVERLRARG